MPDPRFCDCCAFEQLMRVAEYRAEGYSEKLSLARGMVMTGGIITAAGVIMAIAFGALMFSEVRPTGP